MKHSVALVAILFALSTALVGCSSKKKSAQQDANASYDMVEHEQAPKKKTSFWNKKIKLWPSNKKTAQPEESYEAYETVEEPKPKKKSSWAFWRSSKKKTNTAEDHDVYADDIETQAADEYADEEVAQEPESNFVAGDGAPKKKKSFWNKKISLWGKKKAKPQTDDQYAMPEERTVHGATHVNPKQPARRLKLGTSPSYAPTWNASPKTAKDLKGQQVVKAYYASGKIKSEKAYNNGVLNGESKGYYEDGKLMYIDMYANGKHLNRAMYNRLGELEYKTSRILVGSQPGATR